jgi:hypothetical protein
MLRGGWGGGSGWGVMLPTYSNLALRLRACGDIPPVPICLHGLHRVSFTIFFCSAGPRSRRYGRTAALRFIVQPCDEDH